MNEEENQLNQLKKAMDREEARQEKEATLQAAPRSASQKKAREESDRNDVELQAQMDQEDQENEDQGLTQETLAALPKAREDGSYDLENLQACIETLLFLSDSPLKPTQIRDLLGGEIPKKVLDEAIEMLSERLSAASSGLEIAKISGGIQIRTKSERAPLARMLAKTRFQRLSKGAMETLAIIAYRQPVMKESIDQVRGVDSSHFLRTLLERNLIAIEGRSELPGRPMMYGTTEEFLKRFSIDALSDLPPLSEIEKMVPDTLSNMESDPRITEMRKLVHSMDENTQKQDYDPAEDEKFLQDIRERVKNISVSTPTIEEMDNPPDPTPEPEPPAI